MITPFGDGSNSSRWTMKSGFKFDMSQIDPASKEQKIVTDDKESLIVQPEGPNVLQQVPTEKMPSNELGDQPGGVITILDTDYDKYLIFGNCFSEDIQQKDGADPKPFHRYTVAVFVRDPENAKDMDHYKDLA